MTKEYSENYINNNLLKEYSLILLEEVDSTNDYAKNLAKKRITENGMFDKTIVLASSQTKGKGRKGRSFQSDKKKGVYMTILLSPKLTPAEASRLTIVAAVAVREAIEKVSAVSCEIKWPNDIIYDDKKMCGILTEMSTAGNEVQHIEVGIGVNVYNLSFGKDLDNVAISLVNAMKKEEEKLYEKLVVAIIESFDKYYNDYLMDKSLISIKDTYNKYLINKDRLVTVIEHNGSYEAIAKGIVDDGELLVEKDNTLIRVNSGEVSIRGVLGYV